MPARPIPTSPSSWLTTSAGSLSGSTYGTRASLYSTRVPPGSTTDGAGEAVMRRSVTGSATVADSSRNLTPWPDTTAVSGESAGKIASTRKPSSRVSTRKSSSKRSVGTTTWAS